MLFPTMMRDANNTAVSLWEAGLEQMRTTQQAFVKQSEFASRMEFPWQVEWPESGTAMPKLTFKAGSADTTREAFHMMADANMKAWGNVAEALAALPSWVKLPYDAPGEFWAKWFDQWQEGKFDGPMTSSMDTMVETMTEAVKKTESTAGQAEMAFSNTAEAADEFMPTLLKKAKGEADDLTLIKGIGEKLSRVLNELGVWHFDQIASWTPENIAWVDEKLAFKGRVQREAWVEQAQGFLK